MGILEGRFLQSLDIACLGTLGCVRAQSTNIWQTVLALGEQFWFSATFGFSVTSSTEYSFKVSDSSLWLSWCISAHSSLWLSRWISAHSSLATQGMSSLVKSLVRIITVEVEQLGSSSGLIKVLLSFAQLSSPPLLTTQTLIPFVKSSAVFVMLFIHPAWFYQKQNFNVNKKLTFAKNITLKAVYAKHKACHNNL